MDQDFLDSRLAAAAKCGSPSGVEKALAAGARVDPPERKPAYDCIDKQWRSPLQWAASSGCERTVAALIEAGARIERRDLSLSMTALGAAASMGKVEAMRALLKAGACPNGSNADPGYSRSDVEIYDEASVQMFERGSSHCPVGFAAWSCSQEAVELLLSAGATVSPWSLRQAAEHAGASIMACMLSRMPQPACNPESLTWAASEAVLRGDLESLRLLLAAGCPVDGGESYSPLSKLGPASHECVKELVERGASVQSCLGWHPTPLMAASLGGDFASIKLLAAHGADLDARDHRGWTAFARCVDAFMWGEDLSRPLSSALLLADLGADIWGAGTEENPAFEAAYWTRGLSSRRKPLSWPNDYWLRAREVFLEACGRRTWSSNEPGAMAALARAKEQLAKSEGHEPSREQVELLEAWISRSRDRQAVEQSCPLPSARGALKSHGARL